LIVVCGEALIDKVDNGYWTERAARVSSTPSAPASSRGCIIARRCDQTFASTPSSLNRYLPSLALSHPSPTRVRALSHPGGSSLVRAP